MPVSRDTAAAAAAAPGAGACAKEAGDHAGAWAAPEAAAGRPAGRAGWAGSGRLRGGHGGPLALAALALLAAVAPVGTFVAPSSLRPPGRRAAQAVCGGESGPRARADAARRGAARLASAERGVDFLGPASLTERERFAAAQNGSAAAPRGAGAPAQRTPSQAAGQRAPPGGAEDGAADAIVRRVSRAWSLLNASSHALQGFCGPTRRSRRQARRDEAVRKLGGDPDSGAPYSAVSHRAGLAWGAGLELRNASSSSAAAGMATTRSPGRDQGRSDDQQQQARRDPYAWRRGVSKGEVRLLSDTQLLDFEGGATSFKLGGHLQRFDLSSLKDRWRHQSSIEQQHNANTRQDAKGSTGEPARGEVQRPGSLRGASSGNVSQMNDATAAGAAPGAALGREDGRGPRRLGLDDACVQPLASVKRYYNEPLAPRDERLVAEQVRLELARHNASFRIDTPRERMAQGERERANNVHNEGSWASEPEP